MNKCWILKRYGKYKCQGVGSSSLYSVLRCYGLDPFLCRNAVYLFDCSDDIGLNRFRLSKGYTFYIYIK